MRSSRWGSDHNRLIFDFMANIAGFKCNKKKRISRFHFQVAYAEETDCKSIIKNLESD